MTSSFWLGRGTPGPDPPPRLSLAPEDVSGLSITVWGAPPCYDRLRSLRTRVAPANRRIPSWNWLWGRSRPEFVC
jgi:hypothetical protein